MNFRQKLKSVDLIPYTAEELVPLDIYAQYNPDRFNFWKELCVEVVNSDFLNMKYSPHVALLKSIEKSEGKVPQKIEKTPYYKMHRKYGKSHDRTIDKIKTFISIYHDIKNNGMKESPIILTQPLVVNEYNYSYEIFEGHHRCAIATFLQMPKIECKVKKI